MKVKFTATFRSLDMCVRTDHAKLCRNERAVRRIYVFFALNVKTLFEVIDVNRNGRKNCKEEAGAEGSLWEREMSLLAT